MKIQGNYEAEQDFELNIASIIDCFVVLIAYLLVSASFISLASMDVAVAVPVVGSQSQSTDEPELEVTVDLDARRNLVVKVVGREPQSWVIPGKGEAYDVEALRERLASMKTKWPSVESALLSADRDVRYREIVQVVEAVRERFPSISLGERT
jgi:biopolymer transport protein ExbD